ncbi:hypothetical protein BH23BAC3_BH23BAC3_33970 [soil metagenome]
MKISQLIVNFLIISSVLFFFTIPQPVNAQQTETLFSGDVSHGGFGGPIVKIGEVAGTTGVWVGGRGGWIINLDPDHAISLGAGGYGLVTDHPIPADDDLFAMNGYGGFIIEYTNQSFRLVHFTASSLIGAGGLMLRDRDFEEVQDDVDSYFVFEPGVNAELNVTNFFRVSAGATYRITSGISRFGFDDSDFSGLNGVITLKFGKFL